MIMVTSFNVSLGDKKTIAHPGHNNPWHLGLGETDRPSHYNKRKKYKTVGVL